MAILCRVFWIAAAIAAILFQLQVLPPLRDAAFLHPTALAVLSGATLRNATIAQIQPMMPAGPDTWIAPAALNDAASIKLALAGEDALLLGQTPDPSVQTEDPRPSIEQALRGDPTSTHLWLDLAIDSAIRQKDVASAVLALKQSYRTGPREGYMAVRRSILAVLLEPSLDPETSRLALEEFDSFGASTSPLLRLLAALRISRSPKDAQQALAARLQDTPIESRKEIYADLLQFGVDITIPDIPRADRPWQ